MQKPNYIKNNTSVFFIGVPKAGTTTIATLLRQHPQLLISKPKETNFHINEFDKPIKFYFEQYFPTLKQDQVFVDMSILNMVEAEITAKRIASDFPNAKLIAILRDPIQRALSDYKASVRTGKEGKEFEDTFLLENKRKQKNLYPFKGRLYFSRGLYGQQLNQFIKFFDKLQLKIILYDDFFDNIAENLKSILEFIGTDSHINFNTDIRRNAARYSIKNKKLHGFLYSRGTIKNFLKNLIPQKIKNPINSIIIKLNQSESIENDVTNLSTEFKNKLAAFYEEDFIILENDFNLNLSSWRKKYYN